MNGKISYSSRPLFLFMVFPTSIAIAAPYFISSKPLMRTEELDYSIIPLIAYAKEIILWNNQVTIPPGIDALSMEYRPLGRIIARTISICTIICVLGTLIALSLPRKIRRPGSDINPVSRNI